MPLPVSSSGVKISSIGPCLISGRARSRAAAVMISARPALSSAPRRVDAVGDDDAVADVVGEVGVGLRGRARGLRRRRSAEDDGPAVVGFDDAGPRRRSPRRRSRCPCAPSGRSKARSSRPGEAAGARTGSSARRGGRRRYPARESSSIRSRARSHCDFVEGMSSICRSLVGLDPGVAQEAGGESGARDGKGVPRKVSSETEYALRDRDRARAVPNALPRTLGYPYH